MTIYSMNAGDSGTKTDATNSFIWKANPFSYRFQDLCCKFLVVLLVISRSVRIGYFSVYIWWAIASFLALNGFEMCSLNSRSLFDASLSREQKTPDRMPRGKRLAPRLVKSGRNDDKKVDDKATAAYPLEKRSNRHLAKRRQARISHEEIKKEDSLHTRRFSGRNNSSQKVRFADEVTVKPIRRISRNRAKKVWYTAEDMDEFRMDVLQCKELRCKLRLKSARCHNHKRRVLLEHEVSRERDGRKRTKSRTTTRNALNLSNVSIESSRKPRLTAINDAIRLEEEIVAEQSFIHPQVSSVCFGPSHRWVFDYYVGSFIDTLCTVM